MRHTRVPDPPGTGRRTSEARGAGPGLAGLVRPRTRTASARRWRAAVQIEHVGSTSVPGLAAKPVIDIVLVVADSADEAAYVPDLEAAGYRLTP